ncbi:MAG: DNA phosphorothioation-dependent restriction protein DptG [Flavobacteriaceae bacterium]|nr:DNA phosphorothioation-dependent restriction protein DptG [Flavobacteriaceae bacterium]
MDIKKASKLSAKDNAVFLIASDKDLSTKDFSKDEITYIKKELKKEDFKIESVKDFIKSIFKSVNEQFIIEGSKKKAVIGRFSTAFEEQIGKTFLSNRGPSGKVLVLDQDTILLLTNLAIGDKEQLHFQELMERFNQRGVYFDSRSIDELINLYERVGNIDRKSDSGDAIYVKSTI